MGGAFLLLAACNASAAGHVRVSLDARPAALVAGRAWTASLAVRPRSFAGAVRVTASGPRRLDVRARGGRGTYHARLVFPAAGRWTLSARAGGSVSRLGSVVVRTPAPKPLTFAWPTSIDLQPDGLLLVVENGIGRVDRVQPSTGEAERRRVDTLAKPYAVASAPGGAIYLSNGGALQRIDGAAPMTIAAASADVGPIAVAPNGGVVYTTDSQAFELTGGKPRVIASGLSAPHGVAVASDGAVLVCDTGADRVVRIDPTGAMTTLVRVAQPRGIDVAGRRRGGRETRRPLQRDGHAPRGRRSGLQRPVRRRGRRRRNGVRDRDGGVGNDQAHRAERRGLDAASRGLNEPFTQPLGDSQPSRLLMVAVLRRLVPVVTSFAVLAGAAQAHTASAATTSPTKGVVLVNTNLGLQNGSAAGTGIVLTKTGEVLTNNHVIAGATSIKVTVPATKRSYVADVIGYDITDDVALLQLENATNLATATMGNSASVKVGQAARAVGNANGGGKLVVTSGKVLRLKQKIGVQQEDGEVAQLAYLIETSARLVPGDSGGPLLDKPGRVIGIDAAGSANTTATNAPGYAIAINHALTITKQIAALRSSTLVHIGATAFMGIDVQNTPQGLIVADVIPGSPAEGSGLASGDVITSVDGTSISSLSSLRAVLFQHHPGDGITVAYTDSFGNAGTTTITLAGGPPQ